MKAPVWYTLVLGVALAVAALAVAGCGGDEAEVPSEVVLLTHDSFAVSPDVVAAFEEETGLELRILQSGDAGEALNKALLTAGNPQGDVLFGVDDNLLSRALDEDLFVEYESAERDQIAEEFRTDETRVTPIDHGEVCLNIDRAWFSERDLDPPTTIDELTDARFRGLTVVENPATSSPGLAFLLATIERFGEDGWQDYWRDLRANGVRVTDGWEEAYTQQFSGAAGSPGKRPIVVSYATSPAAEVIFAGKPLDESPTAAVEDGCFRQIEYAGILRGAPNEEGARRLIDFLLGERFQADVPGSMFVYPVREGAPLPPEFEEHAIVPEEPLRMDAARIAEQRDTWIDQWTEIVLG